MARDASDDYPLDAQASDTLRALLEEVRERIVARAAYEATDKLITSKDLRRAYESIGFPQPELRDAQRIVSAALDENRRLEWLSYGMAAALFVVGLMLVLFGIFGSTTAVQATGMISGTIFQILLLFPIRMAVNARRHNIAIRMLGILLDRVHDPKKLSQILVKNFRDILFPSAIGLEG